MKNLPSNPNDLCTYLHLCKFDKCRDNQTLAYHIHVAENQDKQQMLKASRMKKNTHTHIKMKDDFSEKQWCPEYRMQF